MQRCLREAAPGQPSIWSAALNTKDHFEHIAKPTRALLDRVGTDLWLKCTYTETNLYMKANQLYLSKADGRPGWKKLFRGIEGVSGSLIQPT